LLSSALIARLRMFDKMCRDAEWKTIANGVEFLKIFKIATQVLIGSKYPTISLVLRFRAEIVAALQDLPTDCHGDIDETAHATGSES